MSLSREKIEKLLADHVTRLKMADAPEPDSEMFRDAITVWKEAADELGYREHEIAKACRRVARQPLSWWREQLPAVLAAVEAERTANFAQPVEGKAAGGFVGEKDAAMAASAGCQTCDGSGMAMVFHRQYAGSPELMLEQPDGSNRRIMGRFMLHCHCDYGRWMQARVRATDKPLADRMEGIEAVMAGRSRFVAFDPTRMDDDAIRNQIDYRRLRNSIPNATRSPY